MNIYVHTGQHSKSFIFLLDNTVHYIKHYIMVSNFVLINIIIIIGYHKMLFNALILSHFGYSHVWTNAPKTHLDTNSKLHKKAGRMLLKTPKRTHPEEVLSNIKWSKVDDRWQQQWLFKLLYV